MVQGTITRMEFLPRNNRWPVWIAHDWRATIVDHRSLRVGNFQPEYKRLKGAVRKPLSEFFQILFNGKLKHQRPESRPESQPNTRQLQEPEPFAECRFRLDQHQH